MKNYAEAYSQLQRSVAELHAAAPEVMDGFGHLHYAVICDGALGVKVKELIALGIAVSGRCEGSITYHLTDALKAGADREEIVETIGVAVLMGGAPSVVYGSLALKALQQLESKPKEWSGTAS
ncbi:MAG: carboxymuconolactone decarboxylase family protein [Trueperaceae bacterium]|nr:MAG: carboxymuconolactone decarboxylase family protein [Trueperaceae bacterium]